MAQFQTKIPANVGQASPSAGGNQGFTGKYYIFTYFADVDGTAPAAVTAAPSGVLPCKCTYVGTSAYLGTGSAGTTTITVSSKIIPWDTGTAGSLNTTDAIFGTPVVAFPATTTTVNFDGQGATTTHGSNATTTATGITDAVLKTGSSAQGRQGDISGITTSGTFTGSKYLFHQNIWREDNGSY